MISTVQSVGNPRTQPFPAALPRIRYRSHQPRWGSSFRRARRTDGNRTPLPVWIRHGPTRTSRRTGPTARICPSL